MIVVHGETYLLERLPRKENSPYEWEEVPDITFFGRPANQLEKRSYRIQQGVNGGTDSVFIICSNLPSDIKTKDKIRFMGKIWTIESVGYYFDSSRIVNAKVMSEKYLFDRSPKGINIQ